MTASPETWENELISEFVLGLDDTDYEAILRDLELHDATAERRFAVFRGLARAWQNWHGRKWVPTDQTPPSVRRRQLEAIEATSKKLQHLIFGAQSTVYLRFEIEPPFINTSHESLESLERHLEWLQGSLARALERQSRKGRRHCDERIRLWEPVIELFQDTKRAGESENGPVFRVIAILHRSLELDVPSGDTIRTVVKEVNRKRGFVCEFSKDSTVVSAAGE